jgi:hypothetical protein
MPKYTINGQVINSPTALSEDQLLEISVQLGAPAQQTKPGFLDRFRGTPSWMQSKDAAAAPEAAGGDMTNPMAYLSESQKTEQGPAMKAVGQGVNRAVQVGAGLAKGAVINPVAAAAQVAGGETGRQFAEEAQKSYETQRANAGAEGFDFAELGGAILSPVNRLIPVGPAGSVVGRGAIGGVVGAVLNPVTGENLSLEDVVAGKVEQAGLGALFGRLGAGISGALTPTLKTGTRELMESGIPVTPGQAYEGAWGGLFRQIEKLDIPTMRVNKDAINKGFTVSIGNEVLSSIDDKLPSNIQNGQQAFGYIQSKISKYYDDALDNIGTVKVDKDFTDALDQTKVAIRNNLNPKQATEFNNYLKANIERRIKNGSLEANDLKKIEEFFRKKIDSIKAIDTPAETLKQGYDDAYKAIKGLILRNDKDGSIAKANEAYMKRARFLEAVNKNAAEVTGSRGTFSPAELAQIAGKQGTPTQMGKGEAPLQDLANRAMDVVGDTSQQGANFRNLMIAGKLTGLGALGLFAPQFAIPILTASGMSYKAAQALMQEPGKMRLAVQKAIQDNPQLLGNIASQQGLFGAGQQ